MYKLIINLVRSSITAEFIIHMIIGILINSCLLVIMGQYLSHYLIANDVQIVLVLAISTKIVDFIEKQHNLFYLQKIRRQFRSRIHENIHLNFQSRLFECNWNDSRRLIEKNFDRLENKAKWSIISFTAVSISQLVSMFPTIGYLLWMCYHTPVTLSIIFLVIVLSIKYIKRPEKNINDFYVAWEEFNVENDKKFSRAIHHEEQICMNSTRDSIIKIEKMQNSRSNGTEFYINKIRFLLVTVIVMDLFFKIKYAQFHQIDTIFLSVYLQYISSIMNNIDSIGQFYLNYCEAKQEYDTFKKLFDKLEKRPKIDQIKLEGTITIEKLHFKYPPKDDKQDPFMITVSEKIVLKMGQVVLLHGDISNGKSTFMDIFTGVIPFAICTNSTIKFDDIEQKNGFSAITAARLYCEQEPTINWKPSVYEIISDIKPVYLSHIDDEKTKSKVEINELVENNVWWAIEQACCDDYFKKKNKSCDKKWIYTENFSPSPGLKACIRLAKVFYCAKTSDYSIIIGDELDRAVSSDRAIKAMSNLFKFCKENNKLLIVSAHSSEIQKMNFDVTLVFNKGLVSITN